jgi:hypothetical protein
MGPAVNWAALRTPDIAEAELPEARESYSIIVQLPDECGVVCGVSIPMFPQDDVHTSVLASRDS